MQSCTPEDHLLNGLTLLEHALSGVVEEHDSTAGLLRYDLQVLQDTVHILRVTDVGLTNCHGESVYDAELQVIPEYRLQEPLLVCVVA